MSTDGALFECPRCQRVRVAWAAFEVPPCQGVASNVFRTAHDPETMILVGTVPAIVVGIPIDYAMMAYDIGEAIAQSDNGEHCLDISDQAIARNLPQFIAACIKTQNELDDQEGQDT